MLLNRLTSVDEGNFPFCHVTLVCLHSCRYVNKGLCPRPLSYLLQTYEKLRAAKNKNGKWKFFFAQSNFNFERAKMVESSEKRVTTLQKSINRRQVLGGGWGWRPLPNPFPCLTPPQTMFHTLIHVAQIFILLNQQNRCLHKKSFQKMHRRGKTCFLKTFKINSNQKSQIVDQKSKTLNLEFWQNLKKSFQKMHRRGKTCFLHHKKSNPKTL